MTEVGRCIASQTENSKSIDSVGFVGSCNQIKVVDVDNGKSLGPNKPGEICIKSPTMMTGYFNNPEETEAVLDNDGIIHCAIYLCIFLHRFIEFRNQHMHKT